MFKLEFGIAHRDCLVNELSREMPQIRLVCPGGFILDPKTNDGITAEEVIAVEGASQTEDQEVTKYLENHRGVVEVEILEQTTQSTFIRFLTCTRPETDYCSEAVRKNQCFSIGTEIQQTGIEQWEVCCYDRPQAEQLIEDLNEMGELKYHRIYETSWANMLG